MGTIKASSLQPYLSAVNSFFKNHGREPMALGDLSAAAAAAAVRGGGCTRRSSARTARRGKGYVFNYSSGKGNSTLKDHIARYHRELNVIYTDKLTRQIIGNLNTEAEEALKKEIKGVEGVATRGRPAAFNGKLWSPCWSGMEPSQRAISYTCSLLSVGLDSNSSERAYGAEISEMSNSGVEVLVRAGRP
eukprot:jgi/Tetstr1/462842/TSEL_007792.t1